MSVIGTLGLVALISGVLSLQTEDKTLGAIFATYFSGGQIGLSVLSMAGVMLMVLLRHGPVPHIVSVGLYLIFIFPLFAAAFIVGINPGFVSGKLNPNNIFILWVVYFWFHVLWFIVLGLEPVIPTPEKAGETEGNRVKSIAEKAAQIGK